MIELPFKRLKVYLHFSFFAAVSLMTLLNVSDYALWGLYACLIHETGHLISMLILKQKVDKLVFYGAGIKIVQKEHDIFTPFSIQLVILISGCVMNFCVFYALKMLTDTFDASLFATINCIICMFNLLPLNCMDGGKMLVLIFYKLCEYDLAVRLEKYLRSINAFLIIVIIIILAICGFQNITLYMTLIYILFSALIL